MQAFLDAGVLLVGDGTSTVFTCSLNDVFVSVTNNVGGIGFSSILPSLIPDSASSGTPGVSVSLNKNKVTFTFSTPPSVGSQTRVDAILGYNSL